jgi:hypothetical protein
MLSRTNLQTSCFSFLQGLPSVAMSSMGTDMVVACMMLNPEQA